MAKYSWPDIHSFSIPGYESGHVPENNHASQPLGAIYIIILLQDDEQIKLESLMQLQKNIFTYQITAVTKQYHCHNTEFSSLFK